MHYLFKKNIPEDRNLTPREKWLEATLKNVPTGSRILDAGAGERQYQKFCQHLNYVSQDFAQYDGLGDGHGLQTKSYNNNGLDIVSDIIKIPEPNASFDTIMCIEVLEHIPDPALVFPEFSRLLKPGGQLIITAPFNSLTHFSPYHYSTGLSRYFYEKHLKDNGFEIIEITPNGNYFSYLEQEVRRLPEIAEKFSRSMTYIERIIKHLLLKLLNDLESKNNGSEELLCFGYHVIAQKK